MNAITFVGEEDVISKYITNGTDVLLTFLRKLRAHDATIPVEGWSQVLRKEKLPEKM